MRMVGLMSLVTSSTIEQCAKKNNGLEGLMDSAEKCARKTVSFDPCLHRVHTMYVWQFAYRQARLAHWERIARDSARFSERIKSMELIISPILTIHYHHYHQP